MADFKRFAKFLCLALKASDAGKGIVVADRHNGENAVRGGYGLKDSYLLQAISEAQGLQAVKVWWSWDGGMSVVGFDVAGYGQASFHSFRKGWNVPCRDGWNGIHGGSGKTCRRLSRRLKLQVY